MGSERPDPLAMGSAGGAGHHLGKHFEIRGRLCRVSGGTADLVCFEDVETGEPWRMERGAFEAWARAERVALGDPIVRTPPLRRFRDVRAGADSGPHRSASADR
jgi:hypothetical protein